MKTSLEFPLLDIGLQGYNEVIDLDFPETYFGRNTLLIGDQDSQVRGALVSKIAGDDLIDMKFGVRNTSLPKAVGGYGWMDLTTDEDGLNLTILYGQPLWEGASLELNPMIETPYQNMLGDGVMLYGEAQLNQKLLDILGVDVNALGRVDINNFSPDQKPNYHIGMSISR